MKKILAFVSFILDPVVVFGFVVAIAALGSMEGIALIRFFWISIFGMLMPPISLLAWAIHTKKISNWDISNRKQRIRALSVFILFLLVDLFLVYGFGSPVLFRLFLVLSFWFIGFWAITFFWKISGHVSANALVGCLLIRWFGSYWWPILFILPFIAWVRVKQKKHTVGQAVAGGVYAVSVFFILFFLGMV